MMYFQLFSLRSVQICILLLYFVSYTGRQHCSQLSTSSTWTETYAIFHPKVCLVENGQKLKNLTRSKLENSQSSHQKSPKSPYGGISPSLLYETFRASNSVWKIGITRFIRITQSKVRPIENLAFFRNSEIFETVLLWTASLEWSLWYQFSTQNLMP